MRHLVILTLTTAWAVATSRCESPEARAKAALALAGTRPAKTCNCTTPLDCTCAPGACACDACQAGKGANACNCPGPENCTCAAGACGCPNCFPEWTEAFYRQCLRKPCNVVVWVGDVQPVKIDGFVGAKAKEMDGGETTGTIKRGAVFCVSNGEEMGTVKAWKFRPSAATIKAALAEYEKHTKPEPTWEQVKAQVPVYLPAFQPPPWPVFGGGFRPFGGGARCSGGG